MSGGLTVCLGTTSPLKREAVGAALKLEGVDFLQLPEFQSEVNEQPAGRAETSRGAVARALAAVRHARQQGRNGSVVGIGIENGMSRQEGENERGVDDKEEVWVDEASIVVATAVGDEEPVLVEGWSDVLLIPRQDIQRLREDPRAWDSAKDAPTGAVTWSPLKDPHCAINPLRPRAAFLSETLARLVAQQAASLPAELVALLQRKD